MPVHALPAPGAAASRRCYAVISPAPESSASADNNGLVNILSLCGKGGTSVRITRPFSDMPEDMRPWVTLQPV